jgi:signal transduction histidine kinase
MEGGSVRTHRVAGRTILVIDNDGLYLELFREIVEHEGYEVATAVDGMEGIERAKQGSFYCMFVDLIMPRIDGRKFVKCIRQMPRFKHVPIAIMSGALAEEGGDLEEIGANFYLYKGPVPDLRKNIVRILRTLTQGTAGKRARPAVLGISGMHRRAVVKELLCDNRHREVVLEHMGEAVIETDARLRITYINAAGMKIFARSEGETIGATLDVLFSQEVFGRIRKAVEALAGSSSPEKATLVVPIESYVLRVVIAVLVEMGENTGTILIAEDITDYYEKVREVLEANEKLKTMQDKLVQEAKFSMVGQLSATISREIENPLVSALSYLSVVLRQQLGDEESRGRLERVQEEVQRAREMLRDLSEFGQESLEGAEEAVGVDALLKRIVALVRHRAAAAKVTIVEKYAAKLPSVRVDANKMKQVVMHLINNAVESMPNGGTLSINAAVLGEQAPDGEKSRRIMVMEVRDTGEGIAPEFLPRIFDPFFSAKGGKEGTGLGLSTSLKIVEEMGGTIEAHSRLGEGSTFTVRIPVSGPGNGHSAQGKGKKAQVKKKR